MTHRHKLKEQPSVTQMDDTLQQTYYWLAMAADVTSTVDGCVQCAKTFGLYEKAS